MLAFNPYCPHHPCMDMRWRAVEDALWSCRLAVACFHPLTSRTARAQALCYIRWAAARRRQPHQLTDTMIANIVIAILAAIATVFAQDGPQNCPSGRNVVGNTLYPWLILPVQRANPDTQ